MIVIPKITVSTLSRDSLTLTWNYETTAEDLALYNIYVLRSEGQSGPYTQISSAMLASANYQYLDSTVNLFSKNREYYYRLKVKNTSTGDEIVYGSAPVEEVIAGANPKGAYLEAPPDLQAIEAIRRNDILLRNYTGRKVLFMHRRTTGTRCSNCWDHLKRRRTQSNCSTCYDTGITGGYYYPQETYASKAPENILSNLSPIFEVQPKDVIFTFSSFPRLSVRDLIIADDRRFRIINVRRAEKLWSLTHQVAQLRELSKDQAEYSIDITSWGATPFTASPPKQFINASDIDSYYSAVERLGLSE